MKKILSALCALLAVLTLTACATHFSSDEDATELSSKPKIEGITYYGDVPANPKRVVSLSMTLAGNLAALDLPVVGATSYDLANPALKKVLKDAKEVTSEDVEAVAALKPDVIVVYSTDENVDKLAKIAPVVTLDWQVQKDYLSTLTIFGQIFDREKQANTWANQWKEKTTSVAKELKEKTGKDATFSLYGVTDTDITLFGKDFARGGEIVYQGFGYAAPKKVADQVFSARYLSISQEVVADYAGDYLIVATADAQLTAPLFESDVWKNIPAVKKGHIIAVDSNLFSNNDPLSLDYELDILTQKIKDAAAS